MNLNHMIGRNKAMMVLGDVHKRVSDMTSDCHDELIPVKDIQFNSLDTMKIGSEFHTLKPIAQNEISNRLGIPITYLRRCSEELQSENLNHWLGEEKNEKLFVRFKGDEVRAIFTPRYKPVDNSTVIEKLYEMGFKETELTQCHIDEEFMLLNLPSGDKSFSINPHDRMVPGISISNSEVGISSLGIAAYILRLVCTNGLITTSAVNQNRYRHVSDDLINRFPDLLGGVSFKFTEQKAKLKISLESPVESPRQTIDNFNRQFQITPDEQKAIQWAWQFEYGSSMYNIIQTYTKGAQFAGLSAESSYRLQTVGGKILDMVRA